MGTLAIPDRVVARFRTLGLERLGRIESAWVALTHGTADAAIESNLFRDLHTLKGDARLVGFSDVALLCQRLEDLVFAARERRYRVREEVDILVTMSVQFVAMLLRKKGPAGGIDLAGFIKQIEELLRDFPKSSDRPGGSNFPPPNTGRDAREREGGTQTTRASLSGVATTLYLEHLRARGGSRLRLRDAWTVLVREVSLLESSPLVPLLTRHAAAASDLARDLGKMVNVTVEGGDTRASAEVIETLNAAVLHVLRNAVDHGIEPPEARAMVGKPECASIGIRAGFVADRIELVIKDDGGGVNLARVRARAVEQKMMTAEEARTANETELVDLVFDAGFSTSETVNEISGRGIGLDAVRAALQRAGGYIHLESRERLGCTLTLSIPQASGTVDVLSFVPSGTTLRFAVPASWQREPEKVSTPVDLLALLELPVDSDWAEQKGADDEGGDRVRSPAPLVLRSGVGPLAIDVRDDPLPGVAVRICATAPEDAVEIVAIDGEEAILIRPTLFARPVSGLSSPS